MATNIDERIAQWEKMTQEVPDGMAWFSLGSAYRDAERHGDAVVVGKVFRCVRHALASKVGR